MYGTGTYLHESYNVIIPTKRRIGRSVVGSKDFFFSDSNPIFFCQIRIRVPGTDSYSTTNILTRQFSKEWL
jgi:hypothetical protein